MSFLTTETKPHTTTPVMLQSLDRVKKKSVCLLQTAPVVDSTLPNQSLVPHSLLFLIYLTWSGK